MSGYRAGAGTGGVDPGYKCVFTMPDKVPLEKEYMLKAYGAEVVRCPTNVAPESPESYYSVAKRLARERPNAVLANQYHNPMNPDAHYRTTGPEIWRDTQGRSLTSSGEPAESAAPRVT
jgi:cystathionine beta-synthase